MNDPNAALAILVVEDNATTARTLRLFLEPQGYDVAWAQSGSEALATLGRREFDLVLLDLMLPDTDGIAVCRTIRHSSSVPIVMLTARVTDEDIVTGLESGADDYVCKPFAAKVLLARIRRCLRRTGDGGAAPTLFRHGALELDTERRSVQVDDRVVKLTRTEFDILRLLMVRPGRVLTRTRIIDEAIGPEFDGFSRTVDTHIWSLRKKLGDRRDGQRLILAEPGVGYRLSTTDDD